MVNKRNIILFIPIFLVLTFPIWKIPVASFLSPRGGDEPEDIQGRNESSHDFAMDQVKILQNQNGKKTAIIRAKSALTGDNANEFHLESVDADLIDKDNKITNVVAETGSYNVNTEILTLRKDVVITRLEGDRTMYSQLLIYSDKERTVNSPGKVRFVGEEFNIVGGSMVYDIKTDSYQLSNRVKCVIGGFVEP